MRGLLKPQLTFHQHRYADGLEQCVKPGCTWVDLGAGTTIHNGWLGIPQNELAARARVLFGCDMVTEHLKRNPYLTAAIGASAYSLPIKEQSVDLLTANMVLEHLEHPEAAFQEAARVLRPGGRFVVITPNVRNPVVGLASVLLHRKVRTALAHLVESRELEHIFPTFYRANSPSRIQSLAQKSGLEVQAVEVFNSGTFIHNPGLLRNGELAYLRLLEVATTSRGTNVFAIIRKPE
jgi:ubiquinone/menaquinone biosynthesis C-methylase UbiE